MFKLLLQSAALLVPRAELRDGLLWLNATLSKWSMADVFVVGVFVAFLAANAIRKEAGLLSFQAELGLGFYCFLGYCILSILSSQILASGRSPASQ